MNIIELAQECKLVGEHPHLAGIYLKSLERFAKLVAAHEREACAKLCDKLEQQVCNMWHGQACAGCAATIRARSNT
jgi:hypothetical protein